MINIQPTQLINHDTPSVGYRRGEVSDSYVVFKLFEQSVADLSQRFGSKSTTSVEDPDKLDRMWSERHSLYEHLARTADQFWIAERDGKAIGFARSIVRDGVRQLTELFVLPGEQSGGIGRELISRAFPADTRRRSIIATTDARAQALYLSSGVYPRFPLYFFARQPEPVSVSSDLEMERIYDTPQTVELLSELDKKVLGFRREVDQRWFLSDREGYIYYREGQPVGYGYHGWHNGPFALLEPSDFPAVLAHAENLAAAQGRREFGLELPMVNQAAVDYLLGRGFKMHSFVAIMMNADSGRKFENYILTSPPFLL